MDLGFSPLTEHYHIEVHMARPTSKQATLVLNQKNGGVAVDPVCFWGFFQVECELATIHTFSLIVRASPPLRSKGDSRNVL
jgi:hypothetical protein